MIQLERKKKDNLALTLQISQKYMQKYFENVCIKKFFNESTKHIIWLDINEENYTSFA